MRHALVLPLALVVVGTARSSAPDPDPSWNTIAISSTGGEMVLFDAAGERAGTIDNGTGEDYAGGVASGSLWMPNDSPPTHVVDLATGESRDVVGDPGMFPVPLRAGDSPSLLVADSNGADAIVVTSEHTVRLRDVSSSPDALFLANLVLVDADGDTVLATSLVPRLAVVSPVDGSLADVHEDALGVAITEEFVVLLAGSERSEQEVIVLDRSGEEERPITLPPQVNRVLARADGGLVLLDADGAVWTVAPDATTADPANTIGPLGQHGVAVAVQGLERLVVETPTGVAVVGGDGDVLAEHDGAQLALSGYPRYGTRCLAVEVAESLQLLDVASGELGVAAANSAGRAAASSDDGCAVVVADTETSRFSVVLSMEGAQSVGADSRVRGLAPDGSAVVYSDAQQQLWLLPLGDVAAEPVRLDVGLGGGVWFFSR